MNPNPDKPLDDANPVCPASEHQPAVSGKLVKGGVPVMRGRLVDAAASDAALDDKPAGKPAPDGQRPPAGHSGRRRISLAWKSSPFGGQAG